MRNVNPAGKLPICYAILKPCWNQIWQPAVAVVLQADCKRISFMTGPKSALEKLGNFSYLRRRSQGEVDLIGDINLEPEGA